LIRIDIADVNLTIANRYHCLKSENEKEGGRSQKESQEDSWTSSWFADMNAYREQLKTWQQLQNYDTSPERAMVSKSDFMLGIYELDDE